ncbi:acetylglutamate kinase [Evansella cellulosilytica]|uniref:Acetylglutamate kinase n=1 Tax=Evansella cellulosilytica (strain ATCC 21833 / DSM 2522 / FERM P-1141 / JCM 9156 / N-4) TaxID=649639 RepID=E6TYY7_EVAC2|nr:acetylglutamate kinase [Evansella cellulosilytica]ADU32430.1 acetylglutamate kinase [Evansella cellulosilytica DSM 2522]
MNYLVIKCGGSVLERLPQSFYKNIAELHQKGICKPVIVHGGGPLISSLLTKLGVNTTFEDGLRVTTKEVLNVVEMVLSGSVNKQIVESLQKVGGNAYGISGVDGALLQAAPTTSAEKLGFVGEVVQVKTKLIDQILDQDFIPVISPVGIDREGQKYNINGDVAASAVAQALGAKLCFISDIPGIYAEKNGVTKTFHELSQSEAESLIEQEVITGGMIPKVRAAIDGLTHNVDQVVILNGMETNSITHFLEGKKIGTKMIADREMYHV